MASAVASSLPPAGPPYGWLSPRVSFSRDADPDPAAAVAMAVATPEPAISKDFIDFEFSLGGSATMLPADELFADGKLLPLRKAAPLPDPEASAVPPPARQTEAAMPAPAEPVKPLRAAAVAAAAADGTDPYVFSPKAPSCSSRWRELLGLKRAAAAAASRSPTAAKPSSASPAASAARTPAARAASSAAARSLKLLLQRNTAGRAAAASAAPSDLASAPLLLRDSSDSEASLSLASSRFSLSSSSSSSGHDHDEGVPRLSLDSAAADPPRIRLVRSSHRHSTSSSSRGGRSPARRRPSPPRCLSVDSPRMNSSGKIVFQGLERSSSSPCSFHAAAASKSRSRAGVDRSYSSGVRVAPVVLNVPVCSRPVFGFFKDRRQDAGGKQQDCSAGAAAARSRSSLRRKAQAWSGELPRSSGC